MLLNLFATTDAGAQCNNISGGTLTVSANPVHVGQVISYTVGLQNSSVCDASNVVGTLIMPNKTNFVYITDATLLANNANPIQCPGGPGCAPGPYTYTVSAADLTGAVNNVSCPNYGSATAPKNKLIANATGFGYLLDSQTGDVVNNFTDCRNVTVTVLVPCIGVTKQCSGFQGESGTITFGGTVTNCGNTTLFGVTVTDSIIGQVLSISQLAAGQSTNYSGNYFKDGCGPSTDTVTASGTDTLGSNVTAEASATCSNTVSPAINVTKQCDGAPFKIGDPIRFKGTVSNPGDVTLLNVSVVDNHAGTVLSGVTLAPGASTNYSGSYAPTGNGCGPYSDTVTASGTTPEACGSRTVTNSAGATCSVVTAPGIAVTKNCVGGPFEIGSDIHFGGTVSNTGDVTLVSVSVSDSAAGLLLSGITLAPGASTNYSGSYNPGAGCGPFTNTVTATGLDLCTSAQVQAQAIAICSIHTSPGIRVTEDCVGGPFAIGSQIHVGGTIFNTGNVTLVNVSVSSANCGTILSGITLAPGASTNYTCAYTPAAGCGPFTNTVTATGNDICSGGQVNAQATAVCSIQTSPGIRVTEDCVGGPFDLGSQIHVGGTIFNTGDVTLVNVSVSSANCGTILSGITLAPGASTNYTCAYTPAAGCGPSTNTVTATGNDACTGNEVNAEATAICPIRTAPGIAVTKQCEFSNTVVYISGSVMNTGNITLINITLNDSDAGNITASLSATTLAPGASATFNASYNASSLVATDTVTAAGIDQCSGAQVQAQATATCSSEAHLCITKLVACSPQEGSCASGVYSSIATGVSSVASGAPGFCYKITVLNCGPVDLVITNLDDSLFGNVTTVFTNALGGTLLSAGNSATFYLQTNESAGVINIATANGYEAVGQTAVSASSTATTVVKSVDITCTKSVATNGGAFVQNLTIPAIPGNQTVIWKIEVTNAGTWPLTGVTIADPALAGVCDLPAPFDLGVGASFTYLCTDSTVNCAQDLSSLNPNTATVSGEADSLNGTVCVIGTNGAPASASHSCTASLVCRGHPMIAVTKLIACIPANTDCSTLPLSAYGKSATGVVNQALGQYPAFCYSIIVSNPSADETLTHITVTDDSPDGKPDVSGCVWPDLPPGGSAICSGILATHQANTIDTVTAIGVGAFTGQIVTQQDSAAAVVLPVGASCTKYANGQAGNATINLISGGTTDITYSVVIHNTGAVDLQNIQGVDDLCQTNFNVEFLAAGDSVTVDLCVVTGVTCPPNPNVLTNIVSFTAEVSDNAGVCMLQSNGVPVTVSNSCQNVVTIKCSTPGCRTTGGGKQYAAEHQVCPITDPAFNSDVRYVTHGGQIGAPYGSSSNPTITDCATGAGAGFNNPCIRGEYQHVRHMKGGLRGTFHAASNGNEHDFDSLKCACLPCDNYELSNPFGGCHPADRLYTGSGILEDGLCNPGRTPNCGPEPRKAPANKLACSGITTYTKTNGKKTQLVVFRIDIEDRGEPGNLHAITTAGKINPPDRYRMRMWFVSGDPNSAENRRLREAVAVKDAHDERVGTAFGGTFQVGKLCNGAAIPAPDIDDGGDLDRGNRQIHPNTGATCND